MYELEKKIARMFLPLLETYEISVPEMVGIAKYRIDNNVTRDNIMKAMRLRPPESEILYSPYYDSFRPPPEDRGNRINFIQALPKIIRNYILIELRKMLNDEKLWKRRNVYSSYIKEIRL